MRRVVSAPTAGWTMSLRSLSASGSLKTMSATAWRSSVPSAATIPGPNRSTMAANTSVPGCCSSRVIASASMTTAPFAASSAETVDLPDPIPPVSPMQRTGRR